jgi:serine/threonine-protein kinase
LSPRARKRRKGLIITLIVLLIGAVSLVGGYLGTQWWRSWNSHVPNLVSHSLAAARSQLDADRYPVGRITNRFSETVPKGAIIGSDPTSGTRLERGKPVDLVVSLGKDRLTVPDVTRMRLDRAEGLLQTRGIHFDVANVTYRPSMTVGSGNVISSDPTAGTKIKRSATVHFVVSSGPPILDIPTIPQGKPYDAARAILTKARFRVARINAYSNDVSAGGVISVSPSGQAAQGSRVTVVVSRGPEFVTMPSIPTLSSYDDAKAQLENLGLNVDRRVVYGRGDRNLVVGQEPTAGESVHVGATVTLAVI